MSRTSSLNLSSSFLHSTVQYQTYDGDLTVSGKKLSRLLAELQDQGQAFKNGDLTARSKNLELCGRLTAALETPGKTFVRH